MEEWFVLTTVYHTWTMWVTLHYELNQGDGGGGHCLVRMELYTAGWSMCLPLLIFHCTIKTRGSLLAPAHPGGPRKRAVKRLWCGMNRISHLSEKESETIFRAFSTADTVIWTASSYSQQQRHHAAENVLWNNDTALTKTLSTTSISLHTGTHTKCCSCKQTNSCGTIWLNYRRHPPTKNITEDRNYRTLLQANIR